MTETRIVIAEDETLIRMNLREALAGLGYLVVGEAADGETAVRLARQLRPDLVVMDIKMPKLDGIHAAAMLSEERVAPVLLLSAYSGREHVEAARAPGIMGYLIKPFREADLRPAIEIAMARFAELRAMNAQVDEIQETLEARKLVDQAKALLMAKESLSESEAYRRMQRLSMNSRKSMKTIAQAVIIAMQVAEAMPGTTG
jgi:response regulator NasT